MPTTDTRSVVIKASDPDRIRTPRLPSLIKPPAESKKTSPNMDWNELLLRPMRTRPGMTITIDRRCGRLSITLNADELRELRDALTNYLDGE